MSADSKKETTKRASGKRAPRLRDIAELAKVDISVVSRTLNNDPNLAITPETRQRIVDVARQLNYRPNAMARGLRQSQTKMLGLLVPDVANFVYFELIHGIEEQAFEEGYVLVLANAAAHDKTIEAYRRLVLEGRVDGLVVASAADGEDLPIDLDTEPDHVMWVNRGVPDGPSIVEDDERGIELAVEHLATLGHIDIATIAGPQNVDTGRRRLKGFLDAMGNQGLPIRDQYIEEGSFTEDGGFACMEALLQVNPIPTAVVISSLSAAIGALKAAKQAGLHIPEDLSLVAFHDAVIARYVDPPLTTIRMPLRELGRAAVRSLLELMRGNPLPSRTIISTPPEIITRGSTAPPSRQSS